VDRVENIAPAAQPGGGGLGPAPACAICKRAGEHLCRACARNLALGIPALRVRELAACQLVKVQVP
jgi:hypothetical protein